MNVQDMAWYRLWSAFAEAFSVFFGLYSIQLYEREVSKGVRVVSVQDGGLLYRLSIVDDWKIQDLADRLDDRLQQYLCRQRMVITVLEGAIFFRLSDTAGSSVSLVFSKDRGWELSVPAKLLGDSSSEEVERHWDEFATLVQVSSLEYAVL